MTERAILLLPLALSACGKPWEVVASRFETLEAARAAGAVGTGKWLPGSLPATATQIREAHDIDTNEVWFAYVDNVGMGPLAQCNEVAPSSVRLPRLHRWLAAEMEGFYESIESLRASSEAHAFQCRGEEYEYVLLFDLRRRLALGWSNWSGE